MASATTFGSRAMSNNRALIKALHTCFDDLEEYQAMGGTNYSAAVGSVTEQDIDNLMAAINALKATFDSYQGMFYTGAD